MSTYIVEQCWPVTGPPLLHNESSQHQTLADLFGPVKRSIDTNSLSHFLMCPPPNTTTLLGFLDSCSSDSHTTALSHCHPAPTRLRTFQCLEPVSPNNRPHSDGVLHQLQVHSTAAGQGRGTAGRPAAQPSQRASTLTVLGSNLLYRLTDGGCMRCKEWWRSTNLVFLNVLPFLYKLMPLFKALLASYRCLNKANEQSGTSTCGCAGCSEMLLHTHDLGCTGFWFESLFHS